MRLIKVTPTSSRPMNYWCKSCDSWSPEAETFADLDGSPFEAYYCAKCSEALKAQEAAQ